MNAGGYIGFVSEDFIKQCEEAKLLKNLKFPVTFLVMGSLSIKEAKWFALCELISMT